VNRPSCRFIVSSTCNVELNEGGSSTIDRYDRRSKVERERLPREQQYEVRVDQ